jgi:hypothetical protein
MTTERWGQFSVIDHKNTLALIPEVLLYDRFVIPVPDPNQEGEFEKWKGEGYDPELLSKRIDELGDIALPYPWILGLMRDLKYQNDVADDVRR